MKIGPFGDKTHLRETSFFTSMITGGVVSLRILEKSTQMAGSLMFRRKEEKSI